MLNESMDHHHQSKMSNEALDPAYALFRDQTRFWIQRVAVPLIMVIGLFGNLVTMIIMTRRRMRSTTNMYLAALAFADMLYLVLTFTLGLSHYPNMAERRYYFYWRLRPFLMMFTDACSNTSVWLTVTFTIERFIAVKYPMKGKVWCTETRARKLIICVFMFGLLFAAPVPFEWKVIEKRVSLKSAHTTNTNALVNDALDHNHVGVDNDKSVPGNNNNLIDTSAIYETKVLDSTMAPEATTTSMINNDNLMVRPDDIAASIDDDDAARIHSSSGDMELNPYTPSEDSFILALDYSQFGRNETYKTIYYWSTAVIFYFVPLISLTLFNGFLIKSVHHSQRERDKMTNRQSFAKKTIRNDENIITTKTPGTSQEIKFQLNKALKNDCNDQRKTRVSKSIPKSSRLTHLAGLKLILVPSWTPFGPRTAKGLNQFSSKSTILSGTQEKCFSGDIDNHGDISTGQNLSNDHTRPHTRCSKLENETILIEFSAEISSDCNRQQSSIATDQSSKLDQTNDNKGVQTNCDVNMNNKASLNLATGNGQKHSDTGHSSCDRGRSKKAPCDNLKSSPTGQFDCISGDGLVMAISVNEELPREVGSINRSHPSQELAKGVLNSSSLISNNGVNASQPSPPASTQERRITIMLIAVVILFLICQIPSAAMLLYTSVHETLPNTNEHALLLAFGNIFNFLMAINAAGNFILYSFLSKKYRRTFVIIFCGCLGGGGGGHTRLDTRRANSLRTKQHQTKQQTHQQLFPSPKANTSNRLSYSSASRVASVRFGNIDHKMASSNEGFSSNHHQPHPDTLSVCTNKMGQTLVRLSEKFIMGEDRSGLQESRGMLNDDNELNVTAHEGGDIPDLSPKTPPNIVKLKCDPRSPTDFDRTPIKIPLDG